MLKKYVLLVLFFSLIKLSFSQSSLNDYKYVIVPNAYDFLNEADKYQLNSLSKFLFNKYGFMALFENDNFPKELIANSCLALKSNVIKEPGLMKTKLKIELKNCKGEVLYISRVGESREKKYKAAYNIALRESFKSFETLGYKYVPNQTVLNYGKTEEDIQAKNEIEQLKSEIKTLKEEQKDSQTKTEEPVVKVKKQPSIQKVKEPINNTSSNVLYAQANSNGFQLVNNEPKIIYVIKNTGLKNVFLVEDKQAIIYQLEGKWVLEYYENNTLKTKTLQIKF